MLFLFFLPVESSVFSWRFKARHKTKARSFEQYPMMKTLLSKRLHVVIVTMPLRRPTIVVAASMMKEGSSPQTMADPLRQTPSFLRRSL